MTDAQRKSVNSTHLWCVAQAFLIAFVFTGIPGAWENFLVYTYETDGAVDAYWTCPTYGPGDPSLAPYDGLGLPAMPGNYGVRVPGQCPVGTCASIPENITEYLKMGGNKRSGGNWTDGDGPCELDLGPPTVDVCDDDCRPLGQTLMRSTSVGDFRSPADLDSLLDGDFGGTKEGEETLMVFWGLNIPMIVVGIVFELSLLMYTAVRSAVRVSCALDLRLTPLNADRANVAGMLVRAAFELPDSDEAVMGVESTKEKKVAEGNFFKNLLTVGWIKGKVILTGAECHC